MPTVAVMMLLAVSVDTNEMPVLVDVVPAADDTAPRTLIAKVLMPPPAPPLLCGCWGCLRRRIRFLAVRKIRQYRNRMMANGK